MATDGHHPGMRLVAIVAVLCAAAVVGAVLVEHGGDASASRVGSLTMVGDSLNVGTEPALRTALRGWSIETDDVVGRGSDDGISALERIGTGLAPVVVVSLGTNDPQGDAEGFRKDVRTVLRLAGDGRCVVWANVWRNGRQRGVQRGARRGGGGERQSAAGRMGRARGGASAVALLRRRPPDARGIRRPGRRDRPCGSRLPAGRPGGMSGRVVPLTTGGEARFHNEGSSRAIVLVNGGTARAVPGTWSATSELLAHELAPRYGDVTLVEVRYRVKTWNELPSCIADAEETVELVGAESMLLIGFSMGGAVSIAVAGHPAVEAVLGLAPWIPDKLSVDALDGKRLDVLHGAWDRYLPGIPGVSPQHSRAGFERAVAAGAHGTYTIVPRGLHGCAVRRPSGKLLRLPRWRAWVEGTSTAVERFRAATA